MAGNIDHILINGRIRTLDDATPQVSALALAGERIVAYGNDDEMRSLGSVGTVIDNLEGRTVLPGFVDAHIHWRGTAEALHQVQLYDVTSRAQAVQRVAERAVTVTAGEWVIGYGWSQGAWDDPRFPTAQDLDAVTPNHPVLLRSRSGHAVWVNSLALRLAGVDAATMDPPGGAIQRDDAGEPTGIFFEWAAIDLINRHVPPITVDSLTRQMTVAQDLALTHGMTGIHDFDWQDSFQALQVMREQGKLALRVLKQINAEYLESLLHMQLRFGFGDNWLRIGSVKIFADGALGPRTAAMIAPYEGEPDNVGVVVTEKATILDLVSRASAAGFPATVHAIGDRAVRDVLDVYETVRAQEAARGIPRDARRHRIEHVQLIHPDDVNRLAELDIIASMQPIHATSDYPISDRYWGARSAYAYNPRLQLDRGVRVAFGSDCPYDTLGILPGIHAAVTRRRVDGSPGAEGWTPSARLTVDEAVRAYTIGAAYAAGTEDRLGQLKPGFLADIVVLDQDPYHVDADALLSLQVMGTMVGGHWRYRNF